MFKRILGVATFVVGLALIVPVVALPATTTSTVPSWDGSNALCCYGNNGSTPTYGQIVLGTGEVLQTFTFYVNASAEDVAVRGGVGVWDGTKITSVVWQDTVFHTVSGSAFQALTFSPNVTLASGQAYVLFGTALFDGLGGGSSWGLVDDNASYPDGSAVWTNGTDPATALTSPWDGLFDFADLAFSMELGDAAKQGGNRTGYCSVAGNTDAGSGAALPVGAFLDLATGQPQVDNRYTGATPAFYYQGLGISCDRLSGYKPTGELVGYGGPGDPGGYTYLSKN